MKTLVISGFEPFGGEKINPSWDAVSRLPEVIGEYKIMKLELPVTFREAANIVAQKADEISPDVIICVGQAGGRSAITPELVGINLRYAKIPDNAGNQPQDESIIQGGKNAYFSSLPVRHIADEIGKIGIPAQVSYSAGAYVCNDVFYTLLARFEGTKTRVGFIHVPYCTEQNKEPSMSIENIVNALVVAIENLDSKQ